MAICGVAVFAGCATQSDFNRLYEYYFPKHGETVASSVYRPSFDETLFGPPPAKFSFVRQRQLYYALRGDPAAFHAFMHNPDKNVNGAQGEEWDYECLLLLLRLGDDRFSQLLSREDRSTREGAGVAIDFMVDWSKHRFPRTRALYTYRHAGPWHSI
jgi:hypothetical protein